MVAPVGLFGGSFDPIHLGHLAVAEAARSTLGLAQVLFIPAAAQPLKTRAPLAPAAARLAMLHLACASNPAFAALPLELERPPPSYTVDTLEALRQTMTGPLWLILGADAAANLPRWRSAQRVAELAALAVVARPGVNFDQQHLFSALPALHGRLVLIDGPQLGLSSSLLRQRLAAGQSIRYLTPDPVVDYIQQHGLYR